ncbi:MAG: hypothetical protein Q7J25_03325 [Vicinamibacterales bacterium]|nr:hypothetical protein [Vicinamibacterales bacterium]
MEEMPGLKVLAISFLGLAVWTAWDVTIFNDLRDRPVSTQVTAVDGAGKSATYRIIALSNTFFWKRRETTIVVDSDGRNVLLESYLASSGVSAQLNAATDLIAVGTASCEGGAEVENDRAMARADNLSAWLRKVMLPTVEHLFALNLGQYITDCSRDQNDRQRVVLIVAVVDKQPAASSEGAWP